MPTENRIVSPGPRERTVRAASGAVLEVPAGWELLPPGDAALTRRFKAGGPTWTVQVKQGRRTLSRGVWGDASRIRQIRVDLEAERATPAYTKRLQADRQRRARRQDEYVDEFYQAVLEFLDFHSAHQTLAARLAQAVATHATPVGSGTVARTQRIPIERRAESAVIAWMRHQTTSYDDMKIPRVRGKRREVRRMLAERSRRLLSEYRRGAAVDAARCPLQRALSREAT
ncbi:MAG: DUF2293 domain-containing protein [Planctomycetales bacterium]|nr:DUF2293 domain-containing protein [Planctomycetales bacterium]